MTLRSIVCSMVGHVDHGKSQIVEAITGLKIVEKEAGRITQGISAINVPFDFIEQVVGKFKKKIKIPGLLLIDTPGHASFTNLRKRGGSLADIAVLVIDIKEGLMPQTQESIEILKHNKTPFIIAANKIDLIPGFKTSKKSLLENLEAQSDTTKLELEKKLYEIVGKLTDFDIDSDRFDRIDDYTKKVAIIPLSATEKLGIPELLLVLTGLAQKFLEKQLNIDINRPAKGVVLEVKEEKGLGRTIDAIIYDGKIKKNDEIIIASVNEPLVTNVRTLLSPSLQHKKPIPVEEVTAACTVKIVPRNSEDIYAGMPFEVTNNNVDVLKKQMQREVEKILIETDTTGVIVKADSLGSLEALTSLLKDHDILIKKASLGHVSKSDISEASAEENPIYKTVLAFNVNSIKDTTKVKIISYDVIYKIIEDYEEWKEQETKKLEQRKLKGITRPGKIVILQGTVFRQNNPAIVGVEVIAGSLHTDAPLMSETGKELTKVKSLQIEGENATKVEQGKQAAISLPGVTVGRHIFENTILYTDIPEEDFRKLKKMKNLLNPPEVQLLKEIAIIKRRKNPLWGI